MRCAILRQTLFYPGLVWSPPVLVQGQPLTITAIPTLLM